MVWAYAVLTVFCAFSVFLLFTEKLIKNRSEAAACILLTAAAFFIRANCMDYVSADYRTFLAQWVEFFRQNGGFAGLKYSVGNYNVPYLYFLAAFSYVNVNDLFLIKLLSVFFDIILAFYTMRLVGVLTGNRVKQFVAFILVLFMPTVILNGAYWGQCDSIYAAFAVMSLYYAFAGKPVRSVISIALSFAFKLQAVFLIPIFFVLLFTKKIKPVHILIFPATYVAAVLPAVMVGKPFWDTITLYFSQAGSVGSAANYNSPSLFSFYTTAGPFAARSLIMLENLGIAAAFALVAITYIILFVKRKKAADKTIFAAAVLFVVGIPLLLPHMHDRYFFMADVLSLAFACVSTVYLPLPILVSFASLLGYYAFLAGRYLLPMKYGAVALTAVAIILMASILFSNSAGGSRLKSIRRQS